MNEVILILIIRYLKCLELATGIESNGRIGRTISLERKVTSLVDLTYAEKGEDAQNLELFFQNPSKTFWNKSRVFSTKELNI